MRTEDPRLARARPGDNVRHGAEVERVWSMAGHVLTEHRSSLSPYVFELIMYLKYNSRLWGLKDVVNANVARKKETEAAQRRDVMEKDRSEEVEGGQSPT